MKQLSLYFHIPFCRKACPYCDFYFTVNHKKQSDFFKAIRIEIELKKKLLENHTISSIYFGGGTPSWVKEEAIKKILHQIKDIGFFHKNLEVTIELNVEDITLEKMNKYLKMGFNRFSLGVQSTEKTTKSYLNRYVSYLELKKTISIFTKLNITNYNLDLIYGIPTLSTGKWISDLQNIIELKPQHLSLYTLTIENKTRLAYLIMQKKLPPLNSEQIREQFLQTMELLEKNQYEHYEISNWTKNQQYSKHNLSYWQRKDYLGFGPSAHSLFQNKRWYNLKKLATYTNELHKKKLPHKVEILSKSTIMNETVMLALRTMWGLDLTSFRYQFGIKNTNILLEKAKKHIEKELLEIKQNHLQTTKKGKMILDTITSDLFF